MGVYVCVCVCAKVFLAKTKQKGSSIKKDLVSPIHQAAAATVTSKTE
jgi:hypothetical protein